jgi:hypothetical protein
VGRVPKRIRVLSKIGIDPVPDFWLSQQTSILHRTADYVSYEPENRRCSMIPALRLNVETTRMSEFERVELHKRPASW